MPSDRDRLLPQDIAVELSAPIEWVEEARWTLPLPLHVRVRDGSWFVLRDDLHAWESAWELATRGRVAA
jgi:hypothetical protein